MHFDKRLLCLFLLMCGAGCSAVGGSSLAGSTREESHSRAFSAAPTPGIIICGAECQVDKVIAIASPTPTPTPQPIDISVTVPAAGTQHSRSARHRSYVSPATNSVQVQQSPAVSGYPSTYNISCVSQSGGTKICSGTLNGTPGVSYTFVASAYSGASQSGSLLGRGQTTQTIVKDQANTITITLSPVVGEIGFCLCTDDINSPKFSITESPGSSQSFPLSVLAYDEDGYTIATGNAATQYLDSSGTAFTVNATIQQDPSSPANTVTLPNSAFSGPNSGVITGNYDGQNLGNGASIVTSITSSDSSIYIDPAVTIKHS